MHQKILPLLSAITSLQLICRLCSIVTHQKVQQQFPKVFGGLGTFGEEYVIKLHDEAIPHALCTPRNVPIPMREKVKKELDRMESMGVISKVLEPTPWCAGMVVVLQSRVAIKSNSGPAQAHTFLEGMTLSHSL